MLADLLDLELVVRTLYLAERYSVCNCQDDGTNLLVRVQRCKVDLIDAVNNKRVAQTGVEASVILLGLGDASQDNAPDRHFVREVERLLVGQLVKTGSDRSVVSDLDEAASLADVRHVADNEAALL